MLVDRSPPEDVCAGVPELADQTAPVLVQLAHLLDDDQWYAPVRADWAHRSRLTPVHGRHATPAEVLLRWLVVQHLYAGSDQETGARVAESLVLRWFCRSSFQRSRRARHGTPAALGGHHPARDHAAATGPRGAARDTGQAHRGAQAADRSHRCPDADASSDR